MARLKDTLVDIFEVDVLDWYNDTGTAVDHAG